MNKIHELTNVEKDLVNGGQNCTIVCKTVCDGEVIIWIYNPQSIKGMAIGMAVTTSIFMISILVSYCCANKLASKLHRE